MFGRLSSPQRWDVFWETCPLLYCYGESGLSSCFPLIQCVQQLIFDFLLHDCRLISRGGSSPTATNPSRQRGSLTSAPWETLQPAWEGIAAHNLRRDCWTVDMCEFEWPEGSPTHGDWRGNCADGGQSWAAHILLSVCPVIPISANTQAGSEIMFRESSQKALFFLKLRSTGGFYSRHDRERMKRHGGSLRI